MSDLNLKSFDKLYPMSIHKYESLLPSNDATILDKINKIIEYLNSVGKLTNDVVKNWNLVYQWAMNDGLTTGINNKLEDMLAKGEFDPIFTSIIAKIGDITTLTTTDKSNLTNAINELVSKIGNGLLANLTTTDKSSLVNGVNEVNTKLLQSANEDFQTNVFTANVDFGSKYFRIPFMCVTKNGTIIAGSDIRYNGSSDQGRISMGIARSTDNGRTWTNKQVAIANDGINVDHSRVNDGTILATKAGRIYLLGNKWNNSTIGWATGSAVPDPDWDIVLYYSDDDGLTWNFSKSLANLLPAGNIAFIGGVGNGIEMENGTLVFPIQIAPANDTPFNAQSGIMYSNDGGVTWILNTSFVPSYSSESNVVEYPTGTLMINCRNEGGSTRLIYTTTNMGGTWTTHATNNLLTQPGGGCMGSTIIAQDSSQKKYVLYSGITSNSPYRSKRSLFRYTDEVGKWENCGVTYDPTSDGYSCLAYDKNKGRLYVLLEISGSIVFKDITNYLNAVRPIPEVTTQTTYGAYQAELTYTRYVKSTGNDNGSTPYSSSTPCATIKSILEDKTINYKSGVLTTVNIYVMDNLTENITIQGLSGNVTIYIQSDTTTTRNIGNLIINGNTGQVKTQRIAVNGSLKIIKAKLEALWMTVTNADANTITCQYANVDFLYSLGVTSTNASATYAISADLQTTLFLPQGLTITGTFTRQINLSYSQLISSTLSNVTFKTASPYSIDGYITNDLTLLGTWVKDSFHNFVTAQVMNSHNVRLTGAVKSGSFAQNSQVCQLPSWMNVARTQLLQTMAWDSSSNPVPVMLSVDTSGIIVIAEVTPAITLDRLFLEGATIILGNLGN